MLCDPRGGYNHLHSIFSNCALCYWKLLLHKIMFESVKTLPIHAFFDHFSLVPSRSPENIRIIKTSNHSVKVEWDKVKWCFVHGPAVSYEVHFRDVQGVNTDLMHNVTVLAEEDRRLDFTNLEIYWKYGVRIKAFTIKGPGPLSPEITGMTDEWGMTLTLSIRVILDIGVKKRRENARAHIWRENRNEGI